MYIQCALDLLARNYSNKFSRALQLLLHVDIDCKQSEPPQELLDDKDAEEGNIIWVMQSLTCFSIKAFTSCFLTISRSSYVGELIVPPLDETRRHSQVPRF